MLEDKRNIWTSALIYIFGRATFPFLKRSKRAPYPELSREDRRGVLMLQEVHPSRRGAQGPTPCGVRCPRRYLFIWGEREGVGRGDESDTRKNPTTAGLGPPGRLPARGPTAGRSPSSVGGRSRHRLATSGCAWLARSAALGAHCPSFSARG